MNKSGRLKFSKCLSLAESMPSSELWMRAFFKCLILALFIGISGCAFDLSSVKQMPATFSPAANDAGQGFVLRQEIKAPIGTGFPTLLKSNTRWYPAGKIEFGEVYATKDQIVAVEASNIHEAQLVISNNFISGFYLPVEKTFTPVTHPIRIDTQTTKSN
jgi:hypothetical protein